MTAERHCSYLQGPFIGKTVTGESGITRKPAARCLMVTRFVQQCENQRIRIDEWMEREPAIDTNDGDIRQTKCLRVNDPGLRIDFVFDTGERVSKFSQKNIQHANTAIRAAKSDIAWQVASVQHPIIYRCSKYSEQSRNKEWTKSHTITTITRVPNRYDFSEVDLAASLLEKRKWQAETNEGAGGLPLGQK